MVDKFGRVHKHGRSEKHEHIPKFFIACENCFVKKKFKNEVGKDVYDFVCQTIICDECVGRVVQEKKLAKASGKENGL